MFIAPKTLSDVAVPSGTRFGLQENYLNYWLDREKIYHYKNEIHNTNRPLLGQNIAHRVN